MKESMVSPAIAKALEKANQAIQALKLSDCDLTDEALFSGDAHTAAPGIYRCAANTTNIPVTETGYLMVITRADNTKYLQYMASSGKYYYQMLNNGTWGAWQDIALNSGGTWIPSIERATVSNVVGKYQKIGNLYICAISFDLSAVESGVPYILGNSLPGYSSAAFTAIEGNWSSTGNEFGEMGSTSNNNVWFGKNGAAYGLTGSVGKTVRCILKYFA